MTAETFIVLSGVLTYGVPIAFAIYELTHLGGSHGGEDRPPPAPPRPEAPKPLPACLLPKPAVRRERAVTRILEDA